MNKICEGKIFKLLHSLILIVVRLSHIFSRCSDNTYCLYVIKSERQRGIVVDCRQYIYSYEILKCFVNHHINIKVSC